MTTPNKKPTTKELLTEFVAECSFSASVNPCDWHTWHTGRLCALDKFLGVVFAIAFIYRDLSSYQKTPKPALMSDDR